MFLGLEETEYGVWQLLMAVAVHSSAVAFCIGSELVAKGVLLIWSGFKILYKLTNDCETNWLSLLHSASALSSLQKVCCSFDRISKSYQNRQWFQCKLSRMKICWQQSLCHVLFRCQQKECSVLYWYSQVLHTNILHSCVKLPIPSLAFDTLELKTQLHCWVSYQIWLKYAAGHLVAWDVHFTVDISV